MQTRPRTALLLCAALLAALAWRWTDRADAPPQAERAEAPPDIASTTVDRTGQLERAQAASGTTPAEPSLPPDIANLLLRAESGDTQAACQLGTRLMACNYAGWYGAANLEEIRQQERDAVAKGDDEAANRAAAFLLAGTLAKRWCTGLPAGLRHRALEFTRSAALAGEPEAIVRYATGQVLVVDVMKPNAFLLSPQFDTWRTEALAMIESLERSGDPQAVLALLDAYGEGNHLTLLVPVDPVRDAAHLLLAQKMFGEQQAFDRFKALSRVTPAQAEEAESLAEQWHRSRFSGRRYRLEDHTRGLLLPFATDVEWHWPQPSVATQGCFEPGRSQTP